MKRILAAATIAAGFALPAMAQEIPIAVVGPMTGGEASFGAQMKAGAEMAVAEINAAGGVKVGGTKMKLKLTIGDDACDPKQAVAVATKVAGEKVKFVAGHYCSGSSIPSSKVYAEEGIIQISPASTNPKLTDERAGPSIYRVCGRDDQQGSVAGKYLATKFKNKKIAIVHDKSAYGQGLADETKKAMNAAGVKEVLYEGYTKGEKDYTALVTKLKQLGVEILYVGGYHTEAGLITRQMRDQQMKTILVSGDALVTQEFWQITGKAGEGTLMTFSPDPRKNPAVKALVEKFRAAKVEPEGYVLYTYAAVQTWKQAVEKAGSLDTKKVTAAMDSTQFDTVLGKFKFDKKGDPTLPPYVFYEWKDGKYEQL
ncbi:MAG: branched-chain amino acid ABC transporter substrate-binding protein [Proteobacteria bacterium]|nr:branched-chain amino acid ABC transporter substrate-binding protein [Pseudomonadota bacterium]